MTSCCSQTLTLEELTQSGGSEIEYRSGVAAGVQDVIFILKQLAAAFWHQTIPVLLINMSRL